MVCVDLYGRAAAAAAAAAACLSVSEEEVTLSSDSASIKLELSSLLAVLRHNGPTSVSRFYQAHRRRSRKKKSLKP